MCSSNQQRERFLRAFAQDWDFSKLSEFFMYLQSRANVDYKVKCVMLQEAARRERETLGAKLSKKRGATSSAHIPDYRKAADIALHHDVEVPSSGGDKEVLSVIGAEKMRLETSATAAAAAGADKAVMETSDENPQTRRHHRRTSSNDVTDIKRLRLSTPNFENANEESSTNMSSSSVRNSTVVASGAIQSTTSAITTATINNTRRAATPDHRMSSSSFNCELPSSSQSSRSVRHGIPSDINSSPSTPSQRSPTSSTVTSTAFSRHHHHYHPYASSAHPPTSPTPRRRSSSGASTSSTNITTATTNDVVTNRGDDECDMEDIATSKRRALI